MKSNKLELKPKSDEKNIEAPSENCIKDIRELVNVENKMTMPEDFYDLIEFLTIIDPNNPKSMKT